MKLRKLGNMALLAAATLLGQNALAAVVQVTDATLTAAGPAIHWSRTNTYVLNGYCYVKQGQTLTIEAGTIIKGKDGAPGVFGALFITAGAKIFANGTPSSPIVFTAEADNLGTAGAYPNLTLLQRGLWGGIVLLGKAVLNTPSDAGGAAASPKYDIFEGLPDTVTGGQNVNRFGGSDDNDHSGVMRYVSIRHGGKILESNKELNGLSICGVGRGTTLEFIEAYATADDGFEFFGGTVNTRYLVSAFNDDDAFDADQGHSGQHQFWFGIQAADARDKGFELNGEPTGLATGAAPVANFTVYNATLIGAGVGSGGANNNVFTIREYAAPRFYNSIFTDFAQRGISIDAKSLTHLNSGLLDFRENLWFGFTAGNTVANLNVLNSAVLFTDTARSNVIADPLLMGISRTANGGLDPRPQAGSPALASSLTAPANGFLQTAAYKGAFNENDLWLAGWTALSQLGVTPQILPPVFNTQPVGGTFNAGGNLMLTADVAGATSLQWFKDGFAIPGATSATLMLNNVRGSRGGFAGPSSSKAPYLESLVPGFEFAALMTAGDFVNTKADGVTPHRLVGIPDGVGAFDNNDGTFTMLLNHELRSTVGGVRAHGAIGAFVSKLIINKSDLRVLNVSDLATNVFIWNGSSFVLSNAAIARLCAADLPAVSAFYNAATGRGTTNRIFMNGEETTDGRAFAFVATGPEAGKAYHLPYHGRYAWENSVASPFAQDKTIVIGLDDDGVTDSQVYVYIGTKQNTGLEIDKAGLQNGSLYGVSVAGMAQETDATTQVTRNFSLFHFGDVSALSEANLEAFGNTNGVSSFQRVEDGTWDPANPRDFYFLTTASFTGKSRLWRLRFANIATPETGGTLEMLLEGTEGQRMMDNLGISNDGRDLLIQEDPGNQSYLAKIWRYNLASGSFSPLAQHVPAFFTNGAPAFLTQDEESSGIVDVSHILGYRAFLLVDQVHSTNGLPAGTATELVENGQILLLREVDNGNYTLVAGNSFGSVTSAVATVSITAPPAIGDTLFHTGLPGATASTGGTLTLTAPANAIFGTGPLTYQWRINGTNILGANSLTLTLPSFQPADLGAYSLEVRNAAGQAVSMDVPVALVDGAYFGGVIINGPVGARYSVEYAPAVGTPTVWTPLTTVTLPSSPYIYVDTTSSGAARRFYRATPLP